MNASLKNFGFKHKSGILMPVSSLPNKYGIGTFGASAYDFVDFLVDTKTKCWQVLPLNPTSYGDSPYQSPAAVAGNPYFIDPDILQKKGLLKRDELKPYIHDTERVDYSHLFNTRYTLLKLAHSRFVAEGGDRSPAYKSFLRKNKAWLPDYALFMSLKEHFGFASWISWDDEYRDITKARLRYGEFKNECSFWEWVQYEFDCQWQALLMYAHAQGIVVIGDMPIYVALDSMDVWQAPSQFLLDEDFNPTVVAGCPPDGFSPDGQLWGNPIYNWKKMKEENFDWWRARVGYAFRLYDILRIDHFRGFAGYYSIPYGEETARNGKWENAPGIELFREINRAFPKAKIIAEDLGFITPDVRELLLDTGFPGMKILQFAFFDDDSEYLPRTYENENCVVYSGSHDADCTYTWCKNLSGTTLKRFKKECPRRKGQSPTEAVIELALSSRANLAVIPIQDYLEIPNEKGRMNTPSIPDGNWNYRLTKRYRTPALEEKIRSLQIRNKRAAK